MSLTKTLIFSVIFLKAGVVDYETFAKRLEALEAWVVEAEDILQGQDPSHSSDISSIQERMDELKVRCSRLSTSPVFCPQNPKETSKLNF